MHAGTDPGPAGADPHRSDDDVAVAPNRRRRRTLATAVAVLVTAGTLLAGPAFAQGPTPPSDPETSPVAQAAHAEPAVPGTPCSVSARACVNLETQQAWLIRAGKVVRGPMRIASGGAGRATPVGHSFRVYRKDEKHVSGEFKTPDGRPSPMPFSTFFADGGIASHAGDPARSSAGCIRMEVPDAQATFAELQMNDKVQIVNGSAENRARQGPPPPRR